MENKTTIKNTAVVSENAIIGKNCIIDEFAIIYPNVVIEDNTYIGPYSIIGSPTMNFYIDRENHRFEKTIIGKNSIIRSHTVIYENNIIGNNFQTGHHVTIREKSKIGNNCSVGTLSDIQGRVEIGNFVRMHSNVHVGMFTKIEDYVWLFPYVLITNDMYPPHDKLEGCTIKEYAIVGANTTILPGNIIGKNSFVAAGSLVTKNVSEGDFVMGRPATFKKKIEEIKDKNGELLYPWKDYLTENRGYPWQKKLER